MESDLENLISKLEELKKYLEQHKENRNYYYDHAIYKNKPLDSFIYCNNELIELKELVKSIEAEYVTTIGEKHLNTLNDDELDKVLNDIKARSERQSQLIDQLKTQIQQIEYLKIN